MPSEGGVCFKNNHPWRNKCSGWLTAITRRGSWIVNRSLARRWCNTSKTFVYICMKHLILIKVRTADPTWLLYYISVYKNGPWKIKNGISSSKDWSPHVILSFTFWLNSHLESGGPPSLLIMPELLRSDRGGLSVSSPSGEWEDACGLHGWCKLLVLKFYWFSA